MLDIHNAAQTDIHAIAGREGVGRRYSWFSSVQFAHDDLAAARTLVADSDLPSRIACFHAQQSAEKELKALLIASSIPFKKTHDLVALAGLQDLNVSQELDSVDPILLHPWAVEARYPGDLPDATDEEAALVVETAATVLEVASRRITSA